MNRSLSFVLNGAKSLKNTLNLKQNLCLSKQILAANTFKVNKNLFGQQITFTFSTDHSGHGHNHSHKHHHHGSSDPLKEMRKQFQILSAQVQAKHPTQPQLVIKQLYERCQALVGENKKVEILILFELICQFIESKNLIDQYSSFLVMSASNSFLMGKYQQVERRCKLALPFEIKKFGEKHKNIGDIHNMLGISISKSTPNKGTEALEHLSKALNIRKELYGSSGQAAEVLFNAGIIEQEAQQMLEKAQLNYLDAVQMMQNINIQTPLLYVKTKMRLVQVQYKIHQVASKYISDLLRLQDLVGKYKNDKKFQSHQMGTVDMFLSLLHRNLGRKFLQSNNHANAVKFFEQCLKYLRDNKMETQDRIEVLQSCAISYTNLNDYSKAAQILQESQKVVASFPSVTDEYKYHMLKLLSQVYRKTGELDKELITLQKMKALIKETKQKFVQKLDYFQTEICLIYCLGNLKMFDRVIEVGNQSLRVLENEKELPKDQHNDFMSNICAYIAFAYHLKGQSNTALQYFIKSDTIFTESGANTNRYQFHLNIMRKIALIYIQQQKDFMKGFSYLNKRQRHITSHSQIPLTKQLNDLVVVLLDYQIEGGEGEVIGRLIQARYIQRINQVVEQIVKVVTELAKSKQNKQTLSNYYVLIDSIYQIYTSFGNFQNYPNKYIDLKATQQLLKQLISIYDTVFNQQIQSVANNTFQGDEALKQMIKKSLKAKQQLTKLS